MNTFYLVAPDYAPAPLVDDKNTALPAQTEVPMIEVALRRMAVGASMPIYLPHYAAWQTELGLVPDIEQRYCVECNGESGHADAMQTKSVPIAHFYELFTVAEEQEARALAANNPTLEIFFRRLALANTVNLHAYQAAIAQVVDTLSCIPHEKKAERLAKILAGIPWWA